MRSNFILQTTLSLSLLSVYQVEGGESSIEGDQAKVAPISRIDNSRVYQRLFITCILSYHQRLKDANEDGISSGTFHEVFELQFNYWLFCHQIKAEVPDLEVERMFGYINEILVSEKEFLNIVNSPPGLFSKDGRFLGSSYTIDEKKKTLFKIESENRYSELKEEFVKFLHKTVDLRQEVLRKKRAWDQ